jgi:hypothetical protein
MATAWEMRRDEPVTVDRVLPDRHLPIGDSPTQAKKHPVAASDRPV